MTGTLFEKMKNAYFLKLVLICIITTSLFVFTKAICDDEDTLLDTPYENDTYFYYNELLKNALSHTEVLFADRNDAVPLQQIIFYLERQEKSPPVNPVVFVTA